MNEDNKQEPQYEDITGFAKAKAHKQTVKTLIIWIIVLGILALIGLGIYFFVLPRMDEIMQLEIVQKIKTWLDSIIG